MLVLEELEHAERRGARVYAEVVGYGSGNDAWHMVQPRDQGAGAAKVMRAALRDAQRNCGLAASDVGYINAHGTSTPYNDRFETAAIKDVFGEHAARLAVSSTKSMTGHMFGAAGAMEAMACVKSVETGWLPPTINYVHARPECDLDYVPNKARQWTPSAAMSNSFGLGGHNSTIVFRAYAGEPVLMYGHRVVVTGLGVHQPDRSDRRGVLEQPARRASRAPAGSRRSIPRVCRSRSRPRSKASILATTWTARRPSAWSASRSSPSPRRARRCRTPG